MLPAALFRRRALALPDHRILAQYFNFAVLIIQSFQKVGVLKKLAPTQSEPPFLIAQGAAVLLFVVLAIFSLKNSARGVLT